MNYDTNPIGSKKRKQTSAPRRLHNLLTASQSMRNQLTKDTIAMLFGVPSTETADVYIKYAGLIALIDSANLQIQALPKAKQEHLSLCIPVIKSALTAGFTMDHNWNQFMNKISASDLGLLALAANETDLLSGEVELEKTELSKIQAECNSLFNAVRDGELAVELKVILLELLEMMRRSIADYQIRGADGLKRILAESIGRLAIDKNVVDQNSNRAEMKQFWELLKNIAVLFSVARQSAELGTLVGGLIARLTGD